MQCNVIGMELPSKSRGMEPSNMDRIHRDTALELSFKGGGHHRQHHRHPHHHPHQQQQQQLEFTSSVDFVESISSNRRYNRWLLHCCYNSEWLCDNSIKATYCSYFLQKCAWVDHTMEYLIHFSKCPQITTVYTKSNMALLSKCLYCISGCEVSG